MAFDYSKFLNDISIADLALNYVHGWQLDVDSSPNSPKLAKFMDSKGKLLPLGSKITVQQGRNSFNEIEKHYYNEKGRQFFKRDLLIIKRNKKGEQTFWSPHNDTIKGSNVFDFVHTHVFNKSPEDDLQWGKIIRFLSKYLDSDKYVHPKESLYKPTVSYLDENKNLYQLKYVNELSDTSYLTKRLLSDEVINDPLFKGRIKNKVHQFKEVVFDYDSGTNKEHVYDVDNANVFLLHSGGEKDSGIGAMIVSAYVQSKNKDSDIKLTRALGNRSNSIFISNTPKHKPNELFIFENPEDIMAHYQLSKDKMEMDMTYPRYIGTCGSPSLGQVERILKTIIHDKPEKVHITTDNDIAGHQYALKLLSSLQEDVKLDMSSMENIAFLDISVPCKEDNKSSITKNVLALIDSHNKEYAHDKRAQINAVDAGYYQGSARINMQFASTSNNWKRSFDLVQGIPQYKAKYISRLLSTTVDFNDDLKLHVKQEFDKKLSIAIDKHNIQACKDLLDQTGGLDKGSVQAYMNVITEAKVVQGSAREFLLQLSDAIISKGIDLEKARLDYQKNGSVELFKNDRPSSLNKDKGLSL